jgi:hypothetical protein
MSATYHLKCPKCGGPCWDQKNGQFPYKPGTPIAKCKDKECAKAGGVYWEDSKPATGPLKPVPDSAGAALPFEHEKPAVLKSVAEDCGELAEIAWAYGLTMKKLVEQANADKDTYMVDLLTTMTYADMQAGAATVYIQRKRRGA